LFVNVGPVSNRTISIKSGSTVLILLSLLKRLRVDRYSKCCFSCFLSTTYEGGLLSFLFFVTEVERIATKMKHFGVIITLSILLMACTTQSTDTLKEEFKNPPDSARPGVYWYFMNGNQDREEMIADLHAMRDVGIGTVLFLEVNRSIPGPVGLMSEKWQDNLAHAFVEAGNLGMQVMLGTGPGWAGSGGPWVKVENSMKDLVGSGVQVSGPGTVDQVLPVPPPLQPNKHSHMTKAQAQLHENWFHDVAVLAFPTPPDGVATIDQVDLKTLQNISGPDARPQPRFIMPQASYVEPKSSKVLDDRQVVDLTALMQPDGRIHWEAPEGDWTIMRFVARSTGQSVRPAPLPGAGFENDKFNGDTYRDHWDNYQQKILDKVVALGGPLQPGKGLTAIHLDSWEMSGQNWTDDFRREFQKRRGYDPLPFYPAFMGMVVGSLEKTDRFLFDLRVTGNELVLEEYAGTIKKVAHENGLLYSNEPYAMTPANDLDLGSVADIVSAEFWAISPMADRQFSCIEAASISHTVGQRIVNAESFTSHRDAYAHTPANMKNQTDWALAIGINGFMFHTYVHQPLGETARPGMTLGRYGIHWNRHQTFWDFLPAYHRYITRSSHLLREGEAVVDILYLTPEGAPVIFDHPADATEGATYMQDKKGYGFDAVSTRILNLRAKVEDGRIAFPGGSSYRVLVLPNVPAMTPETLACIERLVEAGATVIGQPPLKSPSLINYPACDKAVASKAAKMWGTTRTPATVTQVPLGRGAIYWGGALNSGKEVYPSYAATAAFLSELGLPEDFTSPSGKLRYIHRRTDDHDMYFVSNRSGEPLATEGIFRIDSGTPQLWDAVTGETRSLEEYQHEGGLTRVPLAFAPFQSFFVVFPHKPVGVQLAAAPTANFPEFVKIKPLVGAWEVAFDSINGGPENITFDSLVDWTQHPEPSVRYFSGIATYRKTFDVPEAGKKADKSIYLDLGSVKDICRVYLNGKDLGIVWTAPWRVDITGTVHDTNNELVIEVANGWVNRLIGDQQPGDKNVRKLSWKSGLLDGKTYQTGRYTFGTQKFYNANSPLRPAGLIGPVTLLTSK